MPRKISTPPKSPTSFPADRARRDDQEANTKIGMRSHAQKAPAARTSSVAVDGMDHFDVHEDHPPSPAEAFAKRTPPAGGGVSSRNMHNLAAPPIAGSAPRPEVVALQELYGVPEALGRPRERIIHWLARIQSGLTSAPTDVRATDAVTEQADCYLKDNLRLDVFYLEGILKLYKKQHPELTSMFDDIKAFEDALGAASGARSALQSALTLPNLPAPALEWLRVQVREQEAVLHAEIQKNWQLDAKGHVPVFSRLFEALSQGEWDKYGGDRKSLVAEIDRRLKKFQQSDMDMGVLQGDTGVHELRRQLRWIPIYAVALDGLFCFADQRHAIEKYAPLMDTDLVHSKYAQLPSSDREKNPISFSRSLYLRITQLIDELGQIKDQGESIEAIAHALLSSGCADDLHQATKQAEKILGLPAGAEEEVFHRAQKIYDEMQNVDFVRAVRNEVRERHQCD